MSEREPTESNDPRDPAISALYRRARRGEPAADLDRRILGEAHRVARRRRNRWLVPLSTAAMLLIGVTLLLKVTDHGQYTPERAILLDEPTRAQSRADAAGAPSPRREANELAPMLESRPAPRADSFGASPPPLASPEVMRKAAPPQADAATDAARQPAVWLKEIERLFSNGEIEQGQAELKRFREENPDHPLPDHLRAWETDGP